MTRDNKFVLGGVISIVLMIAPVIFRNGWDTLYLVGIGVGCVFVIYKLIEWDGSRR